MEKAVATHSSTLAWKIPRTEEPGRLQSMGSLRVGHDWATSLSLFTFVHWRGNGNPLQYSCLENPRDRGAWWAAVYGVTQSWTWLKRLSSSSSILCNSAFRCLYLSFSPLLFTSFLFTAIFKAASDSHFAFLHFFPWGWFWSLSLYNVTNLSP